MSEVLVKVVYRALALGAALGVGVLLGRQSTAPPASIVVPAPAPADVVALVGGEPITRDQFIAAMRRYGGEQPGQFQTPEQRRALLDRLIEHGSLVRAAKAAGYESDPVVAQEYERILVNRLQEGKIEQRLQALTVEPAEIERFYSEHKTEYARPARYRIALLRLDKPQGATEEQIAALRDRMAEAVVQVAELPKDTLHFGKIARSHSDDRASRHVGGVVGWLVEHPSMSYKWEKEFLDAAFALQEPGAVSPVVETAKAFYLARLVERQEEKIQPLEALADGIRNRLLQEKQRGEREQVVAELLTKTEVQINEGVLAAIAPLGGPLTPPTPPALP